MKTFSELIEGLNKDIMEASPPTMSSGKSIASSFNSTTVTGETAYTSGPLSWNSLITRSGKTYAPNTKKDFVRNMISLIGQEEAEKYHDQFKNYVDNLWAKNKEGNSEMLIDVEKSFDKSNRPYTEIEFTQDDIEDMMSGYNFGANDINVQTQDPNIEIWQDGEHEYTLGIADGQIVTPTIDVQTQSPPPPKPRPEPDIHPCEPWPSCLDDNDSGKDDWKLKGKRKKWSGYSSFLKAMGLDTTYLEKEVMDEHFRLTLNDFCNPINEAETLHWNTMDKTEREDFLKHAKLPSMHAKKDWGKLNPAVRKSLQKMIKKTTDNEFHLEEELTPSQAKKKEEIVLSMKKNKKEFQERYGDEWESVMHATATKMAKKNESVYEAIVRGDRSGGMPTGADRGDDTKPLMKWLTELEKELKKIRSSYDEVDADVAIWLYQKGRNPKQTAKVLASKIDESVEPLGEAKKKDAWLQITDIYHNHQAEKVHGILVDAQTAQLLNKVYDSLKERKNKKSFINAINKDRKGLQTMVDFSWKMVKKESYVLDEAVNNKWKHSTTVTLSHGLRGKGWVLNRGDKVKVIPYDGDRVTMLNPDGKEEFLPKRHIKGGFKDTFSGGFSKKGKFDESFDESFSAYLNEAKDKQGYVTFEFESLSTSSKFAKDLKILKRKFSKMFDIKLSGKEATILFDKRFSTKDKEFSVKEIDMVRVLQQKYNGNLLDWSGKNPFEVDSKLLKKSASELRKESVNATRYVRVHGKTPRGTGLWMFTIHPGGVDFDKHKEGKDYVKVNDSYAVAAKKAEKMLKSKKLFVAESVELDEGLTLHSGDKTVIKVFIDYASNVSTHWKRSSNFEQSRNLTTDGEVLDGNWMGGKKIAFWNKKGKIEFSNLGSKSAETVQKLIKKMVPKFDLAESVELDEKILEPMLFDQGMRNGQGAGKFIDAMTKAKITVTRAKRKGVLEVFPKEKKERTIIFKAAEKHNMIQVDESAINEALDIKAFIDKIKKKLRVRDFDKEERKRNKEIKRLNKMYNILGLSDSVELDEAQMKDAILVVLDSIEKLGKNHKSTIDNVVKDTKLKKDFVKDAIEFWLDDKKIKKMGSGKKTHYMPESIKFTLSDFCFSEDTDDADEQTSTAGVVHTGDDARVGIKPSKKKKKKAKQDVEGMLVDAKSIGESLERSLRALKGGDEAPQFRSEYCGHPVFKVSEGEFGKCKTRRAKGERWNKFFEDDSPNYSAIRKYSRKNPNKPLVLQNELSGEMSIYRRRMNDQRLKHNRRIG